MDHRRNVISVRLSDAELVRIDEAAHQCGTPRSTYLRRVGLGAVPTPKQSRVERDAIYHLAKIGANLNQLAHHANATGKLTRGAELTAALAELRSLIDDLQVR